MDLNGAFLDTNRLLKPLQRRLHAAWCELRGETALTVPAAGWELARTLDFSSPEAMAESRDRLSLRLDAGSNDIRVRVEKLLRIHKWWADVWLSDDSPYEIRFLSPDEQDKALLLLESIDPACFPSADASAVSTHRDAMIICEALACNGKVLLTSNMELVDEVLVNRWVREHQEEFNLAANKVVFPVDEVFMDLIQTPSEEQAMLNAALGAYWPDDEELPLPDVRDACTHALQTLANPSSHLRRTGQHLLNVWQMDPQPVQRMEAVLARLPGRTRAWEFEHPAHPRP